jgi:hypothetical protein
MIYLKREPPEIVLGPARALALARLGALAGQMAPADARAWRQALGADGVDILTLAGAAVAHRLADGSLLAL